VKSIAFGLVIFFTILGYLGFWVFNPMIKVEASEPTIFEPSLATLTPRFNKPTQAIHLPIVQQNQENELIDHPPNNDLPAEITTTPTVTPTPIPPQSPSENLPTVFGATAIVLIIIFTWLLSFTQRRIPPPHQ